MTDRGQHTTSAMTARFTYI